MNTKRIGIILAVFLLAAIVLAGCTQPNYQAPPSGTGNPPATTADTPDQMAAQLAGGTGNGPGDITSNDLEDMQSSSDDLDDGTSNLSESNI